MAEVYSIIDLVSVDHPIALFLMKIYILSDLNSHTVLIIRATQCNHDIFRVYFGIFKMSVAGMASRLREPFSKWRVSTE